MIRTINIKNYLYIKEEKISFAEGMNVFIGESGVGKSLIANILSIPDKKIKKDIVGKWGEEAQVSINIFHNNQEFNVEFIIGEKVSFFINGEKVTQKKIKDFWSTCIDLHSQGNYQLLYDSQLGIIDLFMNKEEQEIKEKYIKEYLHYENKKEELKDISKKILSDQDTDFYEYHINEIKKVNPIENEDEDLFLKLKKFKSYQEVEGLFEKTKSNLENSNESIKMILNESEKIQEFEILNQQNLENLNNALAIQEDIIWVLNKKEIDNQYQDISYIEKRLQELEDLKIKFKKSLLEIITYSKYISELIDNREYFVSKYKKLIAELQLEEEKLALLVQNLTSARKNVLTRVLQELNISLRILKLDKTDISYSLNPKNYFDITGNSDLELLIKVNIGSEFVPLKELSGGETSRVMLAFKSVLQKISPVSVYVFDEIDSGVSGDIAFKVMKIMRKMSESKQLIVITHLPMVAVNTEALFTIKKYYTEKETYINVKKFIEESDIIRETMLLVDNKLGEESFAYIQSLLRK
jgi:DNA repair protein RecN (Recombination protein N)